MEPSPAHRPGHLAWSNPPAATAELLLLVEDLDALMGSGWNDAALAILQADDRERPTVPRTKRALADVLRRLGRTEQAMAAEHQAEQLARQYGSARGAAA